MEEYSHKSKELDDAVEKLEEVDDSVLQEQRNHVAPNTQHVENQDGEVKAILPHSHTDPEYNSPEAVELNIGLSVPNTVFHCTGIDRRLGNTKRSAIERKHS